MFKMGNELSTLCVKSSELQHRTKTTENVSLSKYLQTSPALYILRLFGFLLICISTLTCIFLLSIALHSGSDRDAAPRCRGGFLPGHGFLRGLLEMIELDRNRKDWMGAGWGWTHLSGHLIILDYVTDETPLPCGPM